MFLYVFPSGPIDTNAILLGCVTAKRAVCIDPSLGSAEVLVRKANSLNLTIDKILLTHSHWDHFADAHALQKLTNAPLYVHQADAANLEKPGSDRLPMFFPIHPVKPEGFLSEGDRILVGEMILEVIHTPGHCPGCVCFYLRKEAVLIAGDTLFKGGFGNLHLPTAEPSAMRHSLKKLAALPRSTRVISGHGGETTIGAEIDLLQSPPI